MLYHHRLATNLDTMNNIYRRVAVYWIMVMIALGGWPTVMTVEVVTVASQPQTDDSATNSTPTVEEMCSNPSIQCSQMPAMCLQCNMTNNCFYGEEVDVNCTSLPEVNCKVSYEIVVDVYNHFASCYYCSP